MKLQFHDYKYYPYEHHLAHREVLSVLGQRTLSPLPNGLQLSGKPDSKCASRLVYFAKVHDEERVIDTIQARLEQTVTAGHKRQATRYSVHGLHEYKGKFNPQIAKAILNIFSIQKGDQVLDPFCGSGTTLVECAQLGASGVGTDLNPFAVFVARAKLLALNTPVGVLRDQFQRIQKLIRRTHNQSRTIQTNERGIYLQNWFDLDVLIHIEFIRDCIEESADKSAPIFLSIASNLLRDYSLQDPNDLRIRRRTSPLPVKPFTEAFSEACSAFLNRLADSQQVIGCRLGKGRVIASDVVQLDQYYKRKTFDAALTSPPYAMALPYIDTQRLSLVWLGLLQPQKILSLESILIGSRETHGQPRRHLDQRLSSNADGLPAEQFNLCCALNESLGETDGFRRRAVPTLLYRYFAHMLAMFRAVRIPMKKGAPFALVVGHNRTVLGGVKHDLNTPHHLSSLARKAGWRLDELIPLQTYQRYGYHMANAVSAETLIVLRNP